VVVKKADADTHAATNGSDSRRSFGGAVWLAVLQRSLTNPFRRSCWYATPPCDMSHGGAFLNKNILILRDDDRRGAITRSQHDGDRFAVVGVHLPDQVSTLCTAICYG
jgi:hypothetical protein